MNTESYRKRCALPNLVKVTRKVKSDPSFGGSGGYSLSQRQQNIRLHNNGFPIQCSERSIRRWKAINPVIPQSLVIKELKS